ncbi:hypothetical protein ACJJTC_013000 [Scirpophaga incertulas]
MHKVKQPRKGKSEQYKTGHILIACIQTHIKPRAPVLRVHFCNEMIPLVAVTLMVVTIGSCGRLEPQYLPPRPGGSGSSGVGFGGGSGAAFGAGNAGGATGTGFGAGSGVSSGAGFGAGAAASSSFSGSGGNGPQIPITKFENVNNGDGTYNFNYETGNGISAHESGAPRAQGSEGPAVTAEGGFSYRAPDGQQISLTYTADENGFHPVGPHLPTPPPIPEEILRSIEFNKRNPSSEGAYNPRAEASSSSSANSFGGSSSFSGSGSFSGTGSGGAGGSSGYHY